MFGGNIERNNIKVSDTSEEKTDQQQVLRCYTFQVNRQVFVNNFPSNSVTVYNVTALYTESGALLKQQELEQTYKSTYDSNTGKGTLYTLGYYVVSSDNCVLGII